MKDLVGQTLSVGDRVIMRTPQYSSICIGTIKEFTPKKVRVTYFNNWNYKKPMEFDILVDSHTLYKIKD
jgi:hypothetical protein